MLLRHDLIIGALAVLCFALAADPVFAANTTGISTTVTGMLPWENGVDYLRRSISGPFAYALVMIGLIMVFGTMSFGGELGAFGKTAIYMIACVSVVVGADRLVQSGVFSGAVIPHEQVYIEEPKS